MAVDAIINHGNLPADGTLLDEANLLVESLTVTPSREEKTYKGPNRSVRGISLTNPTLAFAFKARVGAYAGLAVQHPGTQVTELANFAAVRRGYDPAQGMMVLGDISDESNNEDPDMVSFTVTHWPFVEPA